MEGWFQRAWAVSESVWLWCKMALVTWLGVNVALLGLTWWLGPMVGAWPPIPQALVVNALVVLLLTGVVTPHRARLFQPWLDPPGTGVLVASTKEER